MNGRGGPPPSPPISIGRSSNGAGLYPPSMNGAPPPSGPPYGSRPSSRPASNRGSVASNGPSGPPGPPRKYSSAMIERELFEHHRVLRDFIKKSVQEDKTYQPHNRARDKLLRLSSVQFQELSTDVYDELRRRQDENRSRDINGNPNPNIPRFLPPKQTFHPKRNQARQKLATLASKKFRELATDVLFELERRFPKFTDNGNGMSPPPSGGDRSKIPPPINMNGLGGPGQRPMPSPGPYSPAIFDSGRSVPSSSSSNDFGRPLPGQKTLVPNKSTMVEDDDSASQDDDFDARDSRRGTQKSLAYSIPDPHMEAQFQAQVGDLEQKLAVLEAQLASKDQELESERSKSADFESHRSTFETERATFEGERSKSMQTVAELERQIESERSHSANLTSDLERQLKSAESLNSSLQNELEKLRDGSVKDDDDSEWKDRYEVLEQEFHEQQQVTDEVQQEAMESLQEMRQLSERAAEASEKEESLTKQVSELQDQVEQWKSRFTRTKTQLRHMRTSSMALYIQEPTAQQFAGNGNFHDAKGLIKDISVTRFQVSIDELLKLSRQSEPTAVLDYMRDVITAVRAVTEDIDHSPLPASGGDEIAKKRAKAKVKVSAAANNLITTAKTYSASNGVAPVSLVDAAASHLTGAVVDLIKVVKIRPTPANELDLADDFS